MTDVRLVIGLLSSVKTPVYKRQEMLLREIRNIFHLELDSLYPKEEVDSFFYLLIEHYLNLERFVLVLRPDLIITKEEEQPLFEALAQLKLHRPIQYIIGKTTFMDLELDVDENVLIPRPETEELVRWILDECQVERSRDLKVLDIGTGSGCIAIALARNLPRRQVGLPEAKVYALDVSEMALEVAKRNSKANEVQIEFIQADILEEFSYEVKFDVIVSNPPYVRESEKKEIAKNVKDFEPESALFVRDENPLLFYKAIIDFAKQSLREDGKLYLEINQYLVKETKQLLEANNFKDIEIRKDIFGNHRMLKVGSI